MAAARREITADDCRSCGAWFQDDSGFADCTVGDVKRLSSAVRARLVPYRRRLAPRLTTPASFDPHWGKVCNFLRGTPGQRVSCGIYETRPTTCRTLAPGSMDCIEARDEFGFKP